MGTVYEVKCRDESCGFQSKVFAGMSMLDYMLSSSAEERILKGEEEAPEDVVEQLKAGEHMTCGETYLCPKCREWKTSDAMLVAQVTEVDADGEVLDCVPHYLTGEPPKCDVCGTEMVYIPDPCAPVTKCPRCGLDHMIISAEMMVD